MFRHQNLLGSLKTLLAVIAAFAMAFLPSVEVWANAKSAASVKEKAVEITSVTKSNWGEGPRTFKIGKKTYIVKIQKNANGKTLSKMIIGPDSKEIRVDKDGDGSVDYLELTKADLTLRATEPAYGRFTKLEVEKRKKTGTAISELLFSNTRKAYRVVSTRFEPYKVMHADEDTTFGGQCSATDFQNYGQFTDYMKKISAKGSDEAAKSIACKLKATKGLLFDATCIGPNSAYANSTDAIIDGFSRVLASEQTRGLGKWGKPRYLACAEKFSLAETAAKAEGELVQRLNGFYNSPNLTAAEKAAIDNVSEATGCSLHDPALEAKLTTLKPEYVANKRLFSCENNANINDRGELSVNNVIQIRKTKTQMAQSLTGESAETAYASTIFHELIHLGGVDEHSIVNPLEKCCAPRDNDNIDESSATGCARLVETTSLTQQAQALQGKLSKTNYGDIAAELNHAMDSGNKNSSDSKNLLTAYQTSMTKALLAEGPALDKKYAAGASCGTSFQCAQAKVKARTELWHEYTKKFFKESCPTFITGPNKEKETKEVCVGLEAKFERLTDNDSRELQVAAADVKAAAALSPTASAKPDAVGSVLINGSRGSSSLFSAPSSLLDNSGIIGSFYQSSHLLNFEQNSLLAQIKGDNGGDQIPGLLSRSLAADINFQAGNTLDAQNTVIGLNATRAQKALDFPLTGSGSSAADFPSISDSQPSIAFETVAGGKTIAKPVFQDSTLTTNAPITISKTTAEDIVGSDFAFNNVSPSKPASIGSMFDNSTTKIDGSAPVGTTYINGSRYNPLDSSKQQDRIATLTSLNSSGISIDGGSSLSTNSLSDLTFSLKGSQASLDRIMATVKDSLPNIDLIPEAKASSSTPASPATAAQSQASNSTASGGETASVSSRGSDRNLTSDTPSYSSATAKNFGTPKEQMIPGNILPTANFESPSIFQNTATIFPGLANNENPSSRSILGDGLNNANAGGSFGSNQNNFGSSISLGTARAPIAQNSYTGANNYSAAPTSRPQLASASSAASGVATNGATSQAAPANPDEGLTLDEDEGGGKAVASNAFANSNAAASKLNQKQKVSSGAQRTPSSDETVQLRSTQRVLPADPQLAQQFLQQKYPALNANLFNRESDKNLQKIGFLVYDSQGKAHGCYKGSTCRPTQCYKYDRKQNKFTKGRC